MAPSASAQSQQEQSFNSLPSITSCHSLQLHRPPWSSDLLSRITVLGFFGHTLTTASPPMLQKSPLQVRCEVRTRLPSEYGGEPHLLLYSNSHDDEEHLAIVYGPHVRSTTLDGVRRMKRTSNRSIANSTKLNGTGDDDRASVKLAEQCHLNSDVQKVEDNDEKEESEADRILRGARPVSLTEAKRIDTQHDTNPPSPSNTSHPLLARIHSCCFTGETLGSVRCDCREQLQEAMRLMALEGRGVILYLRQEGRGIGLREKLRAYNLIDQGYDTMEANVMLGHPPDARGYEIASAILRDLCISSVRLLTNNPDKLASMRRDGVVVSERVPMVPASWVGGGSVKFRDGLDSVTDEKDNETGEGPSSMSVPLQDRDQYLISKVQRMGHILDIPQQVLYAVNASKNIRAAGAGESSSDRDIMSSK